MRLALRFWSKVNKTATCWLWLAKRWQKNGVQTYGAFKVNGKFRKAHRVAWALTEGKIPAGLCVLHRCDNPPCVNPAHLFLGTDADNAADRDAKGRLGPRDGEHNGNASLSALEVAVVRAVYPSTVFTQTELGRWFGVCQTTISKAVRNQTWAATC